MTEHHPATSEILQPDAERSSWPGPEPSSVEADVYVWCYALLVVHARKEEERNMIFSWFCADIYTNCSEAIRLIVYVLQNSLAIAEVAVMYNSISYT